MAAGSALSVPKSREFLDFAWKIRFEDLEGLEWEKKERKRVLKIFR